MTVLEKISTLQRNRKRQAEAELRALVNLLADDPNADTDESSVDELLASAGWTLETLRSKVGSKQQANADRAEIAAGDDAKAEIAELEAEAAKHNQALADMQEQTRQKLWPIGCKIEELRQVQQRAANAHRRLTAGCTDKTLVSRLDASRRDIHHANEARKQTARIVEEVKTGVANATEDGGDRLKSAQRALESAQKRHAEADAKVQAILAEQNAIVEEMLNV